MKTILFFLLLLTALEADLTPFLKPALNKDAVPKNQVNGVDFIYIINLDQRPEKFAHCIKELDPFGITPYRFSAVCGWDLTFEMLDQLGVVFKPGKKLKPIMSTCYLPEYNYAPLHEVMHVPGRTYFCHCMARGAIGIVLSHLSILQDAIKSGFETIWIMEDDIKACQNPHLISERIEELDLLVGEKGWDVLFTDPDTKGNDGKYIPCYAFAARPNFTPDDPVRFQKRTNVGAHFMKVGARYGAYSMIVRKSGMKKLLKFFNKYQIYLPYDMDFCMPDSIRLYSVTQDIVSTVPGSPSDNGAPNFKKGQ
jgi:GR25 family glycosyltransferase involved in LPS biosynthesis